MIRRSLRTRGIAPDSDGLSDDIVDSATRTPNPVMPVSSLKPSPSDTGPITFKNAYTGTRSDRSFIDTILNLEKLSDRSAPKEEKDGVKDSDDKNLSGNCDVGASDLFKGVVKNEVAVDKVRTKSGIDVESLDLKSENIARVVSGRIMAVKFFPCSDMRIVVAGSKSGIIGFWNMKQEEDDGIYLYHTHTGPVSGIVFQQSCLSKVYLVKKNSKLQAFQHLFYRVKHVDVLFCLLLHVSSYLSLTTCRCEL